MPPTQQHRRVELPQVRPPQYRLESLDHTYALLTANSIRSFIIYFQAKCEYDSQERGGDGSHGKDLRKEASSKLCTMHGGPLGQAYGGVVKISDLAAEMQCSVGGLYRYYPSKEAIFSALQIQALTALNELLKAESN